MKNDNTKKVIIVSSIVVILLIINVIYFITRRFNNTEKTNNENDIYENRISQDEAIPEDIDPWENEEIVTTENLKLEKMTDLYTYFLMKQCLTTYYSSKDKAFELLDVEAKQTLNITYDNFSNYYPNILNSKIRIDEIYKEKIKTSKDLYVVTYQISNSRDQVKALVKIDKKTIHFSIYPYDFLRVKGNMDIKENDKIIINNFNDIETNNYNRYKVDEISKDDSTCMQELFDRFKYDLEYDVEHLYKLIDNKYKNERFNNYEAFMQFINDNKSQMLQDTLTKYKVTQEYENYTQYTGICDNNNHYIFNVINLMEYSILLDNYTIELPQYSEIYNSMLPSVQAKYCIDRVIKAVNDKNYEFIYNKLNIVQKSEFSSYNDFVKYIKEIFYEENNYEFLDYKKSSNAVYQYLVKITDKTEKTFSFRRLDMQVVLEDDTDFMIGIKIN